MQVTAGVAIPALASVGIKSSHQKTIVVALVKEVKVSIAIVAIMAVFMASYAEAN